MRRAFVASRRVARVGMYIRFNIQHFRHIPPPPTNSHYYLSPPPFVVIAYTLPLAFILYRRFRGRRRRIKISPAITARDLTCTFDG